jgi:hypothetical protein
MDTETAATSARTHAVRPASVGVLVDSVRRTAGPNGSSSGSVHLCINNPTKTESPDTNAPPPKHAHTSVPTKDTKQTRLAHGMREQQRAFS